MASLRRLAVSLLLDRLEDRTAPAVLATGSGPGVASRVVVYDAPGSPTATFAPYQPHFLGGVRVAIAEQGPGADPLIVVGAGPGGGPHVQLFTTTGQLVRSFLAYPAEFSGGVSVAAGDMNGDGRAEIIVGAGPGGGPVVSVFDGASGQLLRSFFAYPAAFAGGVSVAAADVTGDGRADIITGAGPGGGPAVSVFSGATGQLIQSYFAFAPVLHSGVTVAAGDINGDGRADIVVGAGPGGGPAVVAFDGATGQLLRSFYAFVPELSAGVGVGVADINGDGRAEILTTTGAGSDARVAWFDGLTGQQLGLFWAISPTDAGGVSVAGVGARIAPAPLTPTVPPAIPQVPAPSGPSTDGTSTQKPTPPSQPTPPTSPGNGNGNGSGSAPTAVFSNSGSVAEGGTATVTFTQVSGTGVTYSFDFNNDGVFEIINSTVATVAIPSSLTADGPAQITVRGRVTDDRNRSTDYWTSLSVTNVAPTVQLNNITTATGLPVRFTATVFDPSVVDAASLQYLWQFGDGTTSTEVSPTRTFAMALDQSFSLTVTDRSGASATATAQLRVTAPDPTSSVLVTADYILTPFERIPNFGGRPTLLAVQSGNWSNAATWGGRLPQNGEIVSIGNGITVTFDQEMSNVLDTVAIQRGGRLVFRTDINTRLRVSNLLVMEGGELQVGTVSNPVAAHVRAQISFPDLPIDTSIDPEQYGHGIIALGKVTMHGAAVSDTFVRLAAEPRAGDTTLRLAVPVVGWRVGDSIALPDTHQLDWFEQHLYHGNYSPQWEVRTITAISADGLTITLSAALNHNHYGARTPDGLLEYQPHVALLTRNVVVRSEDNFGERGHVLFTHRADVDVRFVQFAGLGRTTQDEFNDTRFGTNGQVTHVGTNQRGRYPVHFLHHYGPATPQGNGAQFTFEGNTVVCLMNQFIFRWGLVLNDAHYGVIRDNVVYNWAGAGIVTEAGNESGNLFENNYVSRIFGTGQRSNDGRDGIAYWFRGPNNRVVNNVATNIRGAGPYAYGFNISPVYTGLQGRMTAPAYQGADPTRPGEAITIDVNALPLGEFRGNEVYGATGNGLALWWIGTFENSPRGTAGVVEDFVAWHVYGWGYFGYEVKDLTIDGFTVIGDSTRIAPENRGYAGLWFSDYGQRGLVMQNINVQGMRRGVEMPYYAHGDVILRDSYLRNAVNVIVGTMWTVHGGDHLPARRYFIDNVRMISMPGDWRIGQANILMAYNGGSKHNVIQRDEVFVTNYNGVAGDNFQVYYYQQAADFVVPVSGIDPNDPSGRPVVGAPVAGLTNAQAWELYGIAIAGAIAPTDMTRDGIRGFVRPY